MGLRHRPPLAYPIMHSITMTMAGEPWAEDVTYGILSAVLRILPCRMHQDAVEGPGHTCGEVELGMV